MQQEDKIPSCTTRSPKPRTFKKEKSQDKPLALLEDGIFYLLAQKEGRKFGRQRLASVIMGPTFSPQTHERVCVKHPNKVRHLSINNAADLVLFKDLLQRKSKQQLPKEDVDILALPVHHPSRADHALGQSKPMMVKLSDQILVTGMTNLIKTKAVTRRQK